MFGTGVGVEGSPFLARNDSSAVFRFPVCSVGNRGFFGDGLISVAPTAGECERDRLPSGLTTSGLVEPAAKKPSIPR